MIGIFPLFSINVKTAELIGPNFFLLQLIRLQERFKPCRNCKILIEKFGSNLFLEMLTEKPAKFLVSQFEEKMATRTLTFQSYNYW